MKKKPARPVARKFKGLRVLSQVPAPEVEITPMLPVDSQARKEAPIASGVLDYFPLALAAVARLSRKGNEKHNPGEPMHHARNKGGSDVDCIVNHLIDRGTIDPDNGELHDVAAAWRALSNLEKAEEKRLGKGLPRAAKA